MEDNTIQIIDHALTGDGSVSDSQRVSILDFARGEIEHGLSIKQAAEILGVSRVTLYRMIKRGEIVPFNVAGSTKIRATDIHILLRGESEWKPHSRGGRIDG